MSAGAGSPVQNLFQGVCLESADTKASVDDDWLASMHGTQSGVPHWNPNYPNSESSKGSRCLFSAGPPCFHLLDVFLFWPLSRRLSVSFLFKVSFTFQFPHPPCPERVSVPVQCAGWLKTMSEVRSISWSITGIVDYMMGRQCVEGGIHPPGGRWPFLQLEVAGPPMHLPRYCTRHIRFSNLSAG